MMKITDTMILFWDGFFSQWHLKDMEINGIKYNCCEQYMMAQKAWFFNDAISYSRIMKSTHPSTQKEYGRQVSNFDKVLWEEVCRQYVFDANFTKFSHTDYKDLLLGTGDREIVEASPYDKIWGIGLGENNPDALDKAKWKGTNWLGEALMKVRKVLRD